ncbi:MAG: LemA family protein [Lachnospiraceae bacterium]|nr:LemA family protein [Lachnospiraceae bacterium]
MPGIGFILLNGGFLIIVVCFLICGIISYVIKTANALTRLKNKVKELDSDVDAALTKRYDLLQKQYSAVKMYCSHESSTLMETIRLRNGMSGNEKSEVSNKLDRLSKQLRVTMEAYPELRSSEQVTMLQHSCDNAEEHLQAARRLYNTGVTNYNNMCAQFPSSMVASLTGHRQAEYFKADEGKRSDVEFS